MASPRDSYGSGIQTAGENSVERIEEERQANELKKPLLICRLVASYPHVSFLAALGLHIVFAVLSGCLVLKGYDLFPFNFETLPIELREGPWLKRARAWEFRDEYSDRVVRALPLLQWYRSKTSTHVEILYEAQSDIFTKDKLSLIKAIEERVYNISEFRDYCQVRLTGQCVSPQSILRFFDSTYAHVSPVFRDPSFDNISGVLHAAYSMPQTRGALMYVLSRDYVPGSPTLGVAMTRSKIPLGWPLQGAVSYESGKDMLLQFMSQHLQPVLDEISRDCELEVLYYNGYLMLHDAKSQAFRDMYLAVGSLVFIFLYVVFHTRTLCVTCLAVFGIACSFLETNLVYRVILGYQYLGFFHVIAIFVILGIGVDDLFVFWDAWLAAGRDGCPSLAHRLSEAYRKSAKSMFVTSLTTMLAFVVNGLSPLLATSSFGVFAALLVAIDYISVITFFPSIVVVHYLHFERVNYCGFPVSICPEKQSEERRRPGVWICLTRRTREKVELSARAENVRDFVASGNEPSTHNLSGSDKLSSSGCLPLAESLARIGSTFSSGGSACDSQDVLAEEGASPKQDGFQNGEFVPEEPEGSGVSQGAATVGTHPTGRTPSLQVVFFSTHYFRFVTHKVIRWIVLLVLLTVLVTFCVFASRVQRDSEQVQFFRDNHNFAKASSLLNNGFAPNDDDKKVVVYLVWGLKERDLSSCHFSQLECFGGPGSDDSFDASTEAAQQAFVELCQTLKNMPEQEADQLAILRNALTGELIIDCFTTNIDRYFKVDSKTFALNVTLPWDRSKTLSFMKHLSLYYDVSTFNTSFFSDYFDIPVTYWLFDGFRRDLTSDWSKFNHLVGEVTAKSSSRILTTPSVVVGNRIKYIAVAVTTSLNLETLAYTKHLPILENWEQFMEKQLSRMPQELQGGFQTTAFAWHWLHVQKALADNAIFGLGLGVSLALPILVLATCNVINGLLATLVIGSVTICVVGFIAVAGWSMEVLVSLNLCLVAGLAVDYVVHLSEGYHTSKARDRHGRLRDALGTMGSSVLSGAISTLGASVFMLFAQIQFFFQFGIFMFCTIGFSLLFSLGLYTTLMGLVGPQGDTADIRVLLSWCWTRIRRRRENVSLSGSSVSSREPIFTLSDTDIFGKSSQQTVATGVSLQLD